MPLADFSEFSYGYGVVREAEHLLLANGRPLTAAPVLPSLIEENSVGYDAHLVVVDFALFLQFKRSFFVSRRHPWACPTTPRGPHCTWGHWGRTHYRFDVDTTSNQFLAMRRYETEIVSGLRAGASLYAAPVLHVRSSFNRAFLDRELLGRSVGVLPSTFDAAHPSGRHHYSVLPDRSAAAITSEPSPAKPTALLDALRQAMDDIIDRPRDPPSLTDLTSWATERLGFRSRVSDFDRASTSGCVEVLADLAALHGGAFVLLGHSLDAEGMFLDEEL